MLCRLTERLSRKASATEILGERSLRFSNVTKTCEWISFGNGGFDLTPEVIMQTKVASDLGIRANVEYVGYEGMAPNFFGKNFGIQKNTFFDQVNFHQSKIGAIGFRVCAYKPRSLRNGDIDLEWKASSESEHISSV